MFVVLFSEVTTETALEAFCIACIRKSVVVYHELTSCLNQLYVRSNIPKISNISIIKLIIFI